jgi:hypothetical protein
LCIPADLQDIFDKKEIHYSLRTSYLGEAKMKAGVLYGRIHKLIKEVRSVERTSMSKELTDEQIQM